MPPAAPAAQWQASPLGRVGRNTLWLLLGRVAGQGFLFLFGVLIARALGEAGLGRYALMAAVIFIGNVVTTLGLDTLLIRALAREGKADFPLLPQALLLQFGLALLWIVAVWVGTDGQAAAAPFRVYSLVLLPLAFFTVYSAALRAFERMDLYLVANLVTAVGQTVGAAWLLIRGGGLLELAWLLLAAHTAGAAVAGALAWRFLPGLAFPWWAVRWRGLWQTARAGLPLALLMVLAVLFQRLGILAVSRLADEATTGWFSAALRVVEAGKVLPYAAYGALFPGLAHQAAGGRDPGLRRTLTVLLLSSLLFAGLATWLAPLIIPLVFGPLFAPAAGALQVMVWSLFPFLMTLHLSSRLVAGGEERVVWQAHGLALLPAALVYLLAVPGRGLTGAAWAFLAAEVAQALILLARSRRPLPGKGA